MKTEELRALREPIVKQCKEFEFTGKDSNRKDVTMVSGPCKRIEGNLCASYLSPESRWKLGHCGLATHIINVEEQKKKINPIKQSKRG